MNFDTLPPELLSRILNQPSMSLSRRIQLRSVSSSWKSALEDRLKITTQLVLRDAHFRCHEMNDLPIHPKYLTAEFVELLARLFPNVTDLTVDIWARTSATFPDLPQLLLHYRSTLKRLRLAHYYYPFRGSSVRSLTQAINSLTNLTTLELSPLPPEACRMFVSPQTSLLPDLVPTLSRLEALTFPNADRKGRLVFEGITCQCTGLVVHSALLRVCQLIHTKITRLEIAEGTASTLEDIVDKFPSVKYLKVKFNYKNQTHLTTAMMATLCRLESLQSLKLIGLYFKKCLLAPPGRTHGRLSALNSLTLKQVRFAEEEDGDDTDANSAAAAEYLNMTLSAWVPFQAVVTVFMC